MDQRLADLSIDYHGPVLIDQLAEENVGVRLPSFLSLSKYGKSVETPVNPTFTLKLTNFVARKADSLFLPMSKGKCLEEQAGGDYASLAPLEKYMNIVPHARRTHFFQSLFVGDLLFCRIFAVEEQGLIVDILAIDSNKARIVADLNIKAYCPLREVPDLYPHQGPLEAFTIRDNIRALVLGISPDTERIMVSLHQRNLPETLIQKGVKLGLVRDEDVPAYASNPILMGGSYNYDMERILEFSNPKNVTVLCNHLGVSATLNFSAMRGLQGNNIPDSEFAEALRKSQSERLAMLSVKEGVGYFKRGKYTEALQLFNKAIDIDSENVEALVARGALYANNEAYERAINDFEVAIKVNPEHSNARKYLVHTLVAKARSVRDAGEENDAAGYYERALEVDPEMTEAKAGLSQIKLSIEKSRDLSYGPREPPDNLAQDVDSTTNRKTSETLRQLIRDGKSSDHHHSKYKRRSNPEESNPGSNRTRVLHEKPDIEPNSPNLDIKSKNPNPKKIVNKRYSRERSDESATEPSHTSSLSVPDIDWQKISSVMDDEDFGKLKHIYDIVKKNPNKFEEDSPINDDGEASENDKERSKDTNSSRSDMFSRYQRNESGNRSEREPLPSSSRENTRNREHISQFERFNDEWNTERPGTSPLQINNTMGEVRKVMLKSAQKKTEGYEDDTIIRKVYSTPTSQYSDNRPYNRTPDKSSTADTEERYNFERRTIGIRPRLEETTQDRLIVSHNIQPPDDMFDSSQRKRKLTDFELEPSKSRKSGAKGSEYLEKRYQNAAFDDGNTGPSSDYQKPKVISAFDELAPNFSSQQKHSKKDKDRLPSISIRIKSDGSKSTIAERRSKWENTFSDDEYDNVEEGAAANMKGKRKYDPLNPAKPNNPDLVSTLSSPVPSRRSPHRESHTRRKSRNSRYDNRERSRSRESRNRSKRSRSRSKSSSRKLRRSRSRSVERKGGKSGASPDKSDKPSASVKPWKSKWDTPSPKISQEQPVRRGAKGNESLEDLENFLKLLKKKKVTN